MPLTLLLDLDNTLIYNSMETFLPAYFNALGTYLSDLLPPEVLVRDILQGTRAMIENDSPNRTLQSAFEGSFFGANTRDRELYNRRFAQFYAEEFPKLEQFTRPNPAAIEIVETAFARGYTIAIATNPLFPRTAIEERLRWGGLDPSNYPFAIIPSFETFHFAKPHPAFFGELLANIGWPQSPTLMVGDDLQNDIVPAQCLELATFWVQEDPNVIPPTQIATSGQGSIDQLIPWLDDQAMDIGSPSFETPPALQAVLQATIPGIQAQAAPLPGDLWNVPIERGEWSLTEVLCHLRDVEHELNLPRINNVLAEENPFLPGEDTDAWADLRSYATQSGIQALAEFIQYRKRTLGILASLHIQDWDRPARHTIFGPTTLLEMVKIIAGHDRLHIRQIQKLAEGFARDRQP